jgi:hypothetical protein
MSEQEDLDRYRAACHAVQSGVAMEQNFTDAASPKHLRTGLDLRASDHEGLVTLLMEKGIFTREEYLKAMADAAEREKARYEEALSQHFGKRITLA